MRQATASQSIGQWHGTTKWPASNHVNQATRNVATDSKAQAHLLPDKRLGQTRYSHHKKSAGNRGDPTTYNVATDQYTAGAYEPCATDKKNGMPITNTYGGKANMASATTRRRLQHVANIFQWVKQTDPQATRHEAIVQGCRQNENRATPKVTR